MEEINYMIIVLANTVVKKTGQQKLLDLARSVKNLDLQYAKN